MHWEMSGKCKKKRLERILQQCELGIMPRGHDPDEFEIKTVTRATGIGRALSVLSKQFPLASANAMERWHMQVEAAEDPWAEVQRIKNVLRLF